MKKNLNIMLSVAPKAGKG